MTRNNDAELSQCVRSDRLALWWALAVHGPVTAGELAKHTGTDLRDVHEWLGAQVAAGYINYKPATCGHALPEEVAQCVALRGASAWLRGKEFVRAERNVEEQADIQAEFAPRRGR